MAMAAYAGTDTDNMTRLGTPSAGGPAAMSPAEPIAAASTAAPDHIVFTYGKLPIRFEPNVGQTSPEVKYLAQGSGYSLALTAHGVVLSLSNAGKPAQDAARPEKVPAAAARHALLRLNLLHAKSGPKLRAEQRQDSVSNYFIGSDRSKWRSDVANYAAVRYQQAYPGIDWLVYGNPQHLEYDFVVAPQADPRRIRLGVEGADHLALDRNGDLLIKVGEQTLRQLKPVIYQTTTRGGRHSIEGHYVLHHRQLAFTLGGYDHNRTLVIDPSFAYSTYIGGSCCDQATAIAVDGAGNAYITGPTGSTDFPTVNPFQASNKLDNVFIAKFNASGSKLLYSTYLGGSINELSHAIAVDNDGNAYVAGDTASIDFPVVNPFQATNKAGPGGSNGATNAFVTKFNTSGDALLYSTYLGGSSLINAALGIAVDSAGNAYVAGYTDSIDFPTASPLQGSNKGRINAFVTKFNTAGNALLYSTYLGGSSADEAYAIALDASGNAYVTGGTNSTDFPTVNPYQAVNNSAGLGSNGQNAFVSKLNTTGSALLYSTYLGGSDYEGASGIAVDGTGDAYVAGATESLDFPTVNPFQATNKATAGEGGPTAFVTKFNAAGNALVYSTYLGGSGGGNGLLGDAANAIAVDSAGNAYVAGYTASTDFPTSNPMQGINKAAPIISSHNAFITQFNSAGSALLYSSYLGGSGSYGNASAHTEIPFGEVANGIALDNSGNIYVTGQTGSSDFPTFNPYQPANNTTTQYGSNPTAFVSKITPLAAGPTGVVATAGNAQIGLSWSALNGASSYNVYQGTAAGAEASTPVQSGISGTSATITGLDNGTAYYFEVTAVTTAGESARSAEVSATPVTSGSSGGGGGSGGAAGWDLIGALTLAWATRHRAKGKGRNPRVA